MADVEYHIHNGVDSSKISYNNLTDIPTATTSAPTHMLLHTSNAIADTYFYCCAFNSDWTRLFFPNGSGALVMTILRNPAGDKTGTFFQTTQQSVSVGGAATAVVHIVYNATTDKFIACDDDATALYRYDNANSTLNETAITVSGTSLTDVNGIADDGDYVYIFDDGLDVVKRFTFAGSTLTYVDTITLGDNSAKKYLAVDANYIYTYDITNTKYWVFNKTSGATVSSFDVSIDNNAKGKGLTIDPDGNLRQVVAISNKANSDTLFTYLTKLTLI